MRLNYDQSMLHDIYRTWVYHLQFYLNLFSLMSYNKRPMGQIGHLRTTYSKILLYHDHTFGKQKKITSSFLRIELSFFAKP